MPYLPSKVREQIDLQLSIPPMLDPADLNYVLTKVLQEYVGDTCRYLRINDALGAIEAAKHEFYRRAAAPYEDSKIVEHGDVYK